MVLTIVGLTRQGLKQNSLKMAAAKNRLTMSWPGIVAIPYGAGKHLVICVHFLHRNHLLGGVSVQRHRGGKAAVQVVS